MGTKTIMPGFCQKHSENNLISMINYLTFGWHQFKDHRFLGFIETHDDAVQSLVIDGKNYIACHVFFCDADYLCSDQNFKEKPYILMFQGNDDLSYAKRFSKLVDALEFFDKMDLFTRHIEDQCFMYN